MSEPRKWQDTPPPEEGSKWQDVPPPAERPTEQDLVDRYLKTIDPGRALSREAINPFGVFNRGAGAVDYLTGNAPSYSAGVDARVAADRADAEKYPYAHLAGAVGSGFGVGRGAAKLGLTLAREGAPLFERMARGAGEGLGYGSLAGAGSTYTGNPIDYLNNAGEASKLGMVVGAAAPAVLSGLSWAGEKAMQPLNYLRDTKEVMLDRVTKALMDKKQPVDVQGRPMDRVSALETDVRSGAAAGQPEYSVVDAIGKPAQRQLAVVAKQEGPARDLADEFLTGRNVGAPARRAGEIDKTLGVEGTAKQAEDALVAKARTESAPLYERAMDVKGVHNDIIAEGVNHPVMRSAIARGVHLQNVDNAMTGKPFRPTDPAITGFNEAGDPIISGVPNMRTLQTAKEGLDAMIADEIRPGLGLSKYGAALTGFKNRLLAQIDALNPDYKAARAVYGGPMQVRDAIDAGQKAASPTQRFADTLDEFRAQSPTEQQGYRIGYADKLNTALESGRQPSQLLPRSQKGQVELNELSLDQGPLKPTPRGIPEPGAGRPPGEAPWRTFMNREDAMAKTTQQALGGSVTAENAADMLAQSNIGKAAGSLVRLKPQEAWGHAWEALKAAGRGETEAQRTAIARALLANTTNEAEFAALLRALRGAEPAAQHAINSLAPRATALTSGVVGAANRRQ